MAKRYSSLADYFARSGDTQKAAAERWGVSEPTVSLWKRGLRLPKGQQAVDISNDTGVPLVALLTTTPEAAA